MELILEIISWSCITLLWINSEPTAMLRYYLFKDADNFIIRLLNCAMCSGFWIGLIFTFDIQLAAIISILSEFLNRYLNSGKLL